MARRAALRWLTAVFLLTVLGATQVAVASSCAPRWERYFLTCNNGVCQGAFRVTQVDAFGACGRRAKVVDLDAEDSRLLMSWVSEASPNANGIIELGFPQRYWFDSDNNPFGKLAPSLDAALGDRHLAPVGGIAAAAPSIAVAQLNEAFGPRWLSRKSPDSSPEARANERRQWEATATRELWSTVLSHAAYWLGFLFNLAALIWSIDLFFFRLHSKPHDQRARKLLTPVAVQVALGVANAAVAFVTFGFWLGALLVPVVVVVLLAEAWASIRHRRSA